MALTRHAATEAYPNDPRGYDSELNELDDIECQLTQLAARRAFLRSRLNARLDPLSYKLPMEITSYIFELFVQAHMEYEWPGPKAAGVSFLPVAPCIPLRLGAVCKGWRDIAWATPGLWTTLIVALACGKRTMDQEVMFQWLRRTGNRPMAIKVGLDENTTKKHGCDACIETDGKAVIQAINQYASQWQCLDLSGLPDEVLKELDDSKYTDECTPSLLEYLAVGDKLDTPDLVSDMPPVLHKSKRKHCPTHLTLVATFPRFMLNISWTQMSSIHMQSVYPAFCFDIIKAAASAPLKDLSVSQIHGDDEENWFVQETIALPLLVSLTIMEKRTEARISSTLLDSLELPALKSLCFQREVWDVPGDQLPAGTIVSLIHRSHCTLQSLTLKNSVVAADNLIYLLEAVPTVRDLSLVLNSSGRVCINLLQRLSWSHDAIPLLPNLKFLDITAPPLSSWEPLFNIFDCGSKESRNVPAEQRSLREGLRVVYRVHSDPHEDQQSRPYLLDPTSLIDLLSLWHDKGAYCYIRHSFDSASPADLLLQSHFLQFNSHQSGSVYDRLMTMPYLDPRPRVAEI